MPFQTVSLAANSSRYLPIFHKKVPNCWLGVSRGTSPEWWLNSPRPAL